MSRRFIASTRMGGTPADWSELPLVGDASRGSGRLLAGGVYAGTIALAFVLGALLF